MSVWTWNQFLIARVLVEFEPDARIGLSFITLRAELSDLFGRPVDLNTPHFLSRHFRDKVTTTAQVIYERTLVQAIESILPPEAN